jgi:hypothetical protein
LIYYGIEIDIADVGCRVGRFARTSCADTGE